MHQRMRNLQVRLVDGEVVVGVLRRVDATEDAAEQAVIRHVLLRHLSDVEEEVPSDAR